MICSSHDLKNDFHGSSLHFQFILDGLPKHIHSEIIAEQLGTDRVATRFNLFEKMFSNSLAFAFKSYAKLSKNPKRRSIQSSDVVLLLGGHTLLLAGLFSPSQKKVYIPLDCWSGRWDVLARSSKNPLRKTLCWSYARFAALVERTNIRHTDIIGVVSKEERERYIALYPEVADRTVVLPVRTFSQPAAASSKRAAVDSAEGFHAVIWMNAAVDYGRASVSQALQFLREYTAATPREMSVLLLSRVPTEMLAEKVDLTGVTNVEYAEDIGKILSQTDVLILPDVSGSGIKNRAIQGMLSGTGLLVTSVALEGLGLDDEAAVAEIYSDSAGFARGLDAILKQEDADKRQAALQHAEVLMGSSTVDEFWRDVIVRMSQRGK